MPTFEPKWTEADRIKIKNAILKLVCGERVVAVDLGGRMEQYGQVRLQELRDLLAEIEAFLSIKHRVRRSVYSKGL